jgi:hypothetical protein
MWKAALIQGATSSVIIDRSLPSTEGSEGAFMLSVVWCKVGCVLYKRILSLSHSIAHQPYAPSLHIIAQ